MNTEYCRIVYNSVLRYPVRGPDLLPKTTISALAGEWAWAQAEQASTLSPISLASICQSVTLSLTYYLLDYSLKVEGPSLHAGLAPSPALLHKTKETQPSIRLC